MGMKMKIMHSAASESTSKVLLWLIEHGTLVNELDALNRTPLYYACAARRLNNVLILVRHGAILEHGNTIETLDDAANLKLVSFIRDAFKDLNPSATATEMMHLAAGRDRVDVIATLMRYTVSLSVTDSKRRQALYSAIMSDARKTVKYLLKHHVNLSCKDNRGRTAIHHAATGDKLVLFNMLLDGGADISGKDKADLTPLHLSIIYKPMKVFRCLVSQGVDHNCKDKLGMTPLHIAAMLNNREAMKDLLSHGADCTLKNVQGHTAATIAIEHSAREAIIVLVEYGAVPERLIQYIRLAKVTP